MAGKVQPVKWESTAKGGSSDEPYPAELNPNEDGLDCRAVYLENDTSDDKDVELSRDASGNMTFKDKVVSGTKTLADLLAGGEAFDPDDMLTSRNTGEVLVSRNTGNVVMHR